MLSINTIYSILLMACIGCDPPFTPTNSNPDPLFPTGFHPNGKNIAVEPGQIIAIDDSNLISYVLCERVTALGTSFKNDNGTIMDTSAIQDPYISKFGASINNEINNQFNIALNQINNSNYTTIKLTTYALTDGLQDRIAAATIVGAYKLNATQHCKEAIELAQKMTGWKVCFITNSVSSNLIYIAAEINSNDGAQVLSEINRMRAQLGATSFAKSGLNIDMLFGRTVWGVTLYDLPGASSSVCK